MIQIQKISKNFGSRTALQNISFSLEMGEIIGLVGPNGSGKSTLMATLAGVLVPDEGEIFIDEEPLSLHLERFHSILGFAPENPPVLDSMTVKEYLNYIWKLKGGFRDPAFNGPDDVMKLFDLVPSRSRLIKPLSKGLKQRVGLAQVFLGNPRILLLDEPSAGLDPAQRKSLRELIGSCRGERTVLISTHILSDVYRLCDRILILYNGMLTEMSLSAHETPESLEEKYLAVTGTLNS